jgi:hypothetical protein
MTRIVHPEPARDLVWSYATLGGAGLFESVSLYIGYRQFRKETRGRPFFDAVRASKDPTTFTVVFEDSAGIAGVVIAVLGTWLSARFAMPLFEGASVAIGALPGVIAYTLGSNAAAC